MHGRRLQTILGFIRPHKWRLTGILALTVVLSLLAMLPPLLVRTVINEVIVEGRRPLLVLLGVFMLLVPVLHAACGYLQVLGVAVVGQSVVMTVRMTIYDHLLRLSMRFYGKEGVGKLVNRLMGDSEQIQQMLTVASVQVLSDLVCSTFAIAVTFSINWRLAMPLCVVVTLFVLNYKINIRKIKSATRSYRSAEDRVASGVQNRLTANLTVKTFGAEYREHTVFRDQSAFSLDMMRESQEAVTRFHMNTMLLQHAGRAVIYFLGCALVLQDLASYGDVVAFTAYAMQLLTPAVRFTNLAQQLQQVRISADRLFELLEKTPEVRSPPRALRPRRVQGRVDLHDVHFHYEQDRPVLKGLDLHVEPGQSIALVGPTGCGKTTILSLLLRFFDVNSGSICIDGEDVRRYDLRALRSQFGIVLQESLLFRVSIAENIRYSRQSASLEDVRRAAQMAEIHDIIETMPDGYQSRVGSEKVQLSVGQKQRISIARAVLADPAILIMDEATSALDSESERAIQMAMEKFLVGRTSFIVAHRLSTIRNADQIVLLDKGVICEQGNHEALMQIEGGRYRGLYETHAGKGVISDEEV